MEWYNKNDILVFVPVLVTELLKPLELPEPQE